MLNVIIVGGGAAGFFAAAEIKTNFPDAQVTILEKSQKVLSKVKISGGGRCNVCNGCNDIDELSKNYPRGSKQLRKLFGFFRSADTMNWFEKRGVPLVIQEDGCVFPKAQNSQVIIDCLMNACLQSGVKVLLGQQVVGLISDPGGKIQLQLSGGELMLADKVIVTTGGQPKSSGFDWLRKCGHSIEEPVPSLFTFNMPEEPIKNLMGIVVEEVSVSVVGSNLRACGPLLITHWGMSGPAILKLSAFGARILANANYQFSVSVNWLNEANFDLVETRLVNHLNQLGSKQLKNARLPEIPTRLWDFLLMKYSLPQDKFVQAMSQKERNKLIHALTQDVYKVSGKTTFKEEFVTCGGVSLSDVSFKTMESKKMPNLYFAGEVLDIDGVTGGFNFQAAWTTAFIAAKLKSSN